MSCQNLSALCRRLSILRDVTWFRVLIGIIVLLLTIAGCTPSPPPPVAAPLSSVTVSVAAALRLPFGQPATIIGYLIRDPVGTRLVSGMSFSGPTPQPLGDRVILVDDVVVQPIADTLQHAGSMQYGLVAARGTLEPIPDGSGRVRLGTPTFSLLVPEETTPTALRTRPMTDTALVVRLRGVLMISSDSATLAERVGTGGIPAPGVVQIKLLNALQDAALIGQLTPIPDSAVRFGEVWIIGIWQQGALDTLSVQSIR